jgi:hypothetical protein
MCFPYQRYLPPYEWFSFETHIVPSFSKQSYEYTGESVCACVNFDWSLPCERCVKVFRKLSNTQNGRELVWFHGYLSCKIVDEIMNACVNLQSRNNYSLQMQELYYGRKWAKGDWRWIYSIKSSFTEACTYIFLMFAWPTIFLNNFFWVESNIFA